MLALPWLLLHTAPNTALSTTRGHVRSCVASDDGQIIVQCADWLDNFRGAERAVTISAAEAASGQRVGSLGLELLPEASEGGGLKLCPLLSGLIVEPRFRRRGVARRLMNEAEAVALSWGHDEIVLYVESSNAPAVGLYGALGFCADGTDVPVRAQEADDTDGGGGWFGALSRPFARAPTLYLRKRLER